uniref:Uncharacterized protein n=2 Tax=Oreochromis aureus TaxID=47969 RepID=A0AAZ1XH81_OREAU
MCLTETWQQNKDYVHLNEICPSGCSVIGTPRLSGRGGGLAVVYQDRLTCNLMTSDFFSSFESQMMKITNTTKDAEIEHNVAFPNRLYRQTSKATAEDKLAFTIQILNDLFALFEKNRSSAPWEENTVENFLNIVHKQTEELRSCIGSHSNT